MRTVLAAAATAVMLLGPPALAQQQAPAQAQVPAASGDPAAPATPTPDARPNQGGVVPGQQPDPTAQGTRGPTATDTPTQTPTLAQALEQVWNNAVDLQGAPIQGPSTLALPGSGRQPPQPDPSP
jgi:hypothetical protein